MEFEWLSEDEIPEQKAGKTMEPKLTVDEHLGYYYLTWYDEDGAGGTLGQDSEDGCGQEPEDRESWEHWIGSKVARESGAIQINNGLGLGFETESEAKKALAKIRATFKAGRGLPDWAKTALAEGWKAPKGWKP
jgi:hypothetical protein